MYKIEDQSLREVVSLEFFQCTDGIKLVFCLSSNSPLYQKPSTPGPFWLPDAHIIKVQCFITSADPPEDPVCDSYDFFVPMSAILRYARRDDRGSALRIEWGEWGPDNSRGIFTKDTELEYFVHGSRHVIRDEECVTVFDFSPNMESWFGTNLSPRRHQSLGSVTFMGRSMPETLERYTMKWIYMKPDTTCLPYSRSERLLKNLITGYKYDQSAMIDDEHIILVNYVSSVPLEHLDHY